VNGIEVLKTFGWETVAPLLILELGINLVLFRKAVEINPGGFSGLRKFVKCVGDIGVVAG